MFLILNHAVNSISVSILGIGDKNTNGYLWSPQLINNNPTRLTLLKD